MMYVKEAEKAFELQMLKLELRAVKNRVSASSYASYSVTRYMTACGLLCPPGCDNL